MQILLKYSNFDYSEIESRLRCAPMSEASFSAELQLFFLFLDNQEKLSSDVCWQPIK